MQRPLAAMSFRNLSWPAAPPNLYGNQRFARIPKGHSKVAEFGREWLTECFRYIGRELNAHVRWHPADLSIKGHEACFDAPARKKDVFTKDGLLRLHPRAGQLRRPCLYFNHVIEAGWPDVFNFRFA